MSKEAAMPDEVQPIPREVLRVVASHPSTPGPRIPVFTPANCEKPMWHADDLAAYCLALMDALKKWLADWDGANGEMWLPDACEDAMNNARRLLGEDDA